MNLPLRCLFIEDSENDARLVLQALRDGGYDAAGMRVDTPGAMRKALSEHTWDVVISDYRMPHFSGPAALELMKESGVDLPFIIVSGTIGEDLAAEVMRLGAHDYVMKGNLTRLCLAVKRELRSAVERRAQRAAEDALRLQGAALNSAANAIAITDSKGRFSWTNPAFTTLTGYSEAEVIGQTPRILKSDRHSETFYNEVWRTIVSGHTWRGEFINRHKDGAIYYSEHIITPVKADDGSVTHFVAIMTDVTARRKAAEALRNSEMLYRSLVETLTQCIFRKDREGRFTFANRRLCLLLDRSLVEVIGRTDTDIFPPELAAKYQADDLHVLETGQLFADEEIFVDALGNTRHVHVTKTPLLDAEGQVAGVQGVFEDITKQKELENQYRQSQKMEAIGQLAGGIAHDFNNLLMVIQGYTRLVIEEEDIDPVVAENLREVYRAGERAASLTSSLLSFSRKQVMQRRQLNLGKAVENVGGLLRRIIGEHISLKCVVPPDAPVVHADSGMVDQILMNLAVNARDAMPEGGKLEIATGTVKIDEEQARRQPSAKPGVFAFLSVRDSGCGMTPEILSHIFEPFYTTKGQGKGTGLGLATVFGITQQHEGWIEVESEPGQGTTFKVMLPLSLNIVGAPEEEQVASQPKKGTETILVVEDEESVRVLAVLILKRAGYRVLEAASGIEALKVWERHKTRIKLLLTDMVMPDDMTGLQLAKQLLKEKPDLRVIYSSGYSPAMVNQTFEMAAEFHFLQKPYSANKLSVTVRKALDETLKESA